MSEGIEPLFLVMVALTIPLSRVQVLPLSTTVTAAFALAAAGEVWAARSGEVTRSARKLTATSHDGRTDRNIFIWGTPLVRRPARPQRLTPAGETGGSQRFVSGRR